MIIDEKVLNPPPALHEGAFPSPGPPGGSWRTLSALPPHLLLQIVYATFSDAYDIEDAREQRKTLYWLAVGLRLVNRVFYTNPFPFTSHISPPQSKLPTSQSSQSRHPSLSSLQRETPILDLFIALKVREDVWADDSDLHLSRAPPAFTDLFSLMQPRARLEDLVREYGVNEGVVYIERRRARTPGASAVDLRDSGFYSPTSSSSRNTFHESAPTSVVLRSAASYAALIQRLAASSRSSSSGSSFWRTLGGKGKARASPPSTPLPSQKVTIHPLPFSALSISFSSRRVGLVLTSGGGSSMGGTIRGAGSKRTIIEVLRMRDEALEVAARRLVWELKDWLVDGVDGL
ncbi:COesterase domain-containing protein [Mycena venus]|uniref:COesterase domain-containing protein n=1 Tax=Mycena venus TaxID=2733690 RepID=A0A8H6XJ43_9AGAR|nr:COesterase domain-containing protein [Mycena venus]